MNTEALKKSILHRIIETENEDVLIKISSLLSVSENDFWTELSESQKEEIRIGLKQIDSGKTEVWDDFIERVS